MIIGNKVTNPGELRTQVTLKSGWRPLTLEDSEKAVSHDNRSRLGEMGGSAWESRPGLQIRPML